MIHAEVAVVYRAPIQGRRFFTFEGALRRHCRDLISQRCDCIEAEADTGAPAIPCRYHDNGLDWARRVEERFVRLFARVARRHAFQGMVS